MIFDAYEIRARLAPALVVASPLVFVGVALIQQSTPTLASTSAAATVFLALLYAFSFAVRNLGKRIEPGLWSSWGGAPSATLLRGDDTTLSAPTKTRICAAIGQELGVQGTDDPQWANSAPLVQDAFRLVRQFIRQKDPNGLWFKHNGEYGFLRNVLGAWWLWLANSVVTVGICGTLWWQGQGALYLALAALGLVTAVMAILARTVVLPEATRLAALRYAESAWTAFLVNAQSGGKPDGP